MMMKKLAIAGFVSMALSGGAFAQDTAGEQTASECAAGACAIIATGSAQNVSYPAVDGNFVVSDFAFGVSANVGLNSVEDSVGIAVGTASSKGRTAFTGSSNGGSVAACGEATTGSTIPVVPTPELANIAGCAENDPLVEA